MNGEIKTTKFEWPKGKWSEGWLISASAWILGRMTSTNEYELALRSKTDHERAEHFDRATTYNLASNIGAGFFAYEMFKLNPKATSVAIFASLGLSAFVSWASLPNRFNKKGAPPVATGWEPWGENRDWRHRDWENRSWDPHRFGRFGTLGDTGVTVLPPPPPHAPPVTYTPAYMPHTAPPTTYVPSNVDIGPGF